MYKTVNLLEDKMFLVGFGLCHIALLNTLKYLV
jgi:hypothetical protein